MKELDGWRAQARLLQFTFEQHLAQTYGAELICEGSYRFHTLLRVIRKQGLVTQAYLPDHVFHEPGVREKMLRKLAFQKRVYVINSRITYGQYLWVQLLASRLGLKKQDSIFEPMVSLSTGQVTKFTLPKHLLLAGPPEKSLIGKRKISFKKALAQVGRGLTENLAAGDEGWARETLKKLEQERVQLEQFYEHRLSSEEYQRKSAEMQKRLTPLVQIDTIRAALLYLPLFHYRLVVVNENGQETVKNVTYDPIGNLQESD